MKTRNILTRYLVSAAPLALALMGQANGATVVLNLDQLFSDGSTPPSTSAPWLRAVVSDIGLNSVQIDFIALDIGPGEFLSEWYLNLDPALDPANLVFSAPTITAGSFNVLDLNHVGPDFHKVDGDGYYDIEVVFDPSSDDGGINRFTNGDILSYSVSYTGGTINALSFDFLSAPEIPPGPEGPYYSAAHVMATPNGGGGSAWMGAIPEPSTTLSLVLGIGMWLGVARRRP